MKVHEIFYAPSLGGPRETGRELVTQDAIQVEGDKLIMIVAGSPVDIRAEAAKRPPKFAIEE